MSSLRGGGQYRDLAPSEDLSEFASVIATMTKESQKDDSEEFQKNVIAQFLSTTFDYACNTRGKVDLAIYDDEIPKVLFEVKATGNKAEFVKTPDLSLQRQSQNRSTSSLRGDTNTEASVRSTDPHLQIQSYRHSEGAKRPKNPRIKGEFLDSPLRTSCYAQNDESSVDCHESHSDSRNDGFVSDSHNDSTKEILAKYNKIFLSIRICDPAVGSGHFLVSALNELIAIKSELGLLLDCDGRRLSDIDLVLENDELLIKDSLGNALDYRIPAHKGIEAHKIQKAIFYTKKELIENCLFGVDINPNSVEICKLRLWIELLKYSYYENIATKELQTLPNIDINIKCGNSLISYFDLRQSLSHYPNIAVKIKQYQQAVRDYKEGIFANRTQINATIKELLQSFRNFCFSDKFKKEIKSFHAKCESYSKKYGNFLAKDDENLRLYVAQSFGYFDFDEDKARADFANLKKEYESIFSLESNKPFEWRFEFPEVLNAEGDFMGFDLIIGNPPYVVKKKIEYPQYKWNGDLYTMFFEMGFKIAKPNYYVNFITPRFWLVNESLQSMRKYFLEKVNLLSLSESNPFTRAKTENVISEIQVCTPNQDAIKHYKETNEIFNFIDNVEKDIFAQNAKSEIIFNVDKNLIALFDKICKNKIQLKSIMQTKRGAEYGKDFVKKFRKGTKILCGGEVKAYSVEWNKTFIDSKLKDIQRLFDFFNQKI